MVSLKLLLNYLYGRLSNCHHTFQDYNKISYSQYSSHKHRISQTKYQLKYNLFTQLNYLIFYKELFGNHHDIHHILVLFEL